MAVDHIEHLRATLLMSINTWINFQFTAKYEARVVYFDSFELDWSMSLMSHFYNLPCLLTETDMVVSYTALGRKHLCGLALELSSLFYHRIFNLESMRAERVIHLCSHFNFIFLAHDHFVPQELTDLEIFILIILFK